MRRLTSLLISVVFLSGCTGIAPGIGYRLKDDNYKNFVGKQYEVVCPLQIMKYTYLGGEYFLTKADRQETREVKKIADVPVGAIIMVDCVTRTQHIALEDTYAYIGRLQPPAIFSGGFKLNSFMEWKKRKPSKKKKGQSREEKNFKNDFLGLNKEYLKELP